MVIRPEPEKRSEAEYSLEALHRLAGFGQVAYMGRRIQRHIEDLRLSPDEVCDLLGALRPEDFQHAERYEDDRRWHDVYLLPYPCPENRRRKLYIKFRLSKDLILVQLCSFHPEGWP
jgi:hypothetical protein